MSSTARIREFDPDRDRGGVLRCIVELQDYERRIDPDLPPGADMADTYFAFLRERCREWDGRFFVAEEEGEVVGYVSVWAKEPPTSPDEPPGGYAYVSDLIVLEAFRDRGLGRALLERAERYARDHGARVLRIRVLARNIRAQQLYVDMGFDERQVELIKHLGREPESGTS